MSFRGAWTIAKMLFTNPRMNIDYILNVEKCGIEASGVKTFGRNIRVAMYRVETIFIPLRNPIHYKFSKRIIMQFNLILEIY